MNSENVELKHIFSIFHSVTVCYNELDHCGGENRRYSSGMILSQLIEIVSIDVSSVKYLGFNHRNSETEES